MIEAHDPVSMHVAALRSHDASLNARQQEIQMHRAMLDREEHELQAKRIVLHEQIGQLVVQSESVA